MVKTNNTIGGWEKYRELVAKYPRLPIAALACTLFSFIISCNGSHILSSNNSESHTRYGEVPSEHTVKSDSNEPIVSANLTSPSSVENVIWEYTASPMVTLTWTKAATTNVDVIGQKILVFNNSSDCSGAPAAQYSTAASAESYSLLRSTSASLIGVLYFKVEAVYENGDSKLSACSSVKLENFAFVEYGPTEGAEWTIAAMVDLNKDGSSDIVLRSDSAEFKAIAIRTGGSAIGVTRIYSHPTTLEVYASDLNQDGFDDLILTSADTFYFQVSGMNLPASGTLGERLLKLNVGTTIEQMVSFATDFDLDGNVDILFSDFLNFHRVEVSGTWVANNISLAATYQFEDIQDRCDIGQIEEDWNKDGYPDLICLAPHSGIGAGNSGSVIVFPGGATLPASGTISSALLRYFGDSWNHKVGSTPPFQDLQELFVDLNDDGYKDLVSAYDGFGSSLRRGGIHIIFGGATFPASGTLNSLGARARTYFGSLPNSHVGNQIKIFDFSGDGFLDIIAYDTKLQNGNADPALGGIEVVLGGASFPASGIINDIGGRYYTGEAQGWGFTAFPFDFHDFNNDGIDDILVNLTESNINGADSGMVAVLLGGALKASGSIQARSDYVWQGAAAGHKLYAQVADISGNAAPEIIAGSETAAGGKGQLYILENLPASGLINAVAKTYTGESTSLPLGTVGAVGSAGVGFLDLNENGKQEIIVHNRTDTGYIYVIPSATSETLMPTTTTIDTIATLFQGQLSGDGLGLNLGAHDFNADGILDLYSSNASAAAGGTNRGVMFIIQGGSQNLPETLFRYQGDSDNGYFGQPLFPLWDGSVLKFSDINHDGHEDTILLSKNASSGGNNAAGSVYILPGGDLPTSGALNGWIKIEGDEANQSVGENYILEDLNGDNKADFILFAKTGETWLASSGSDVTFQDISLGVMGTSFITVDFDGDGRKYLFTVAPGDYGGMNNNGAFSTVYSPFLFPD